MIQEDRRGLHLPVGGERVERRDSQPVRPVGIHAVLKEELRHRERVRHGDPGRKIRLVAKQQTHERVVAPGSRVREGLGIIGERGVGGEQRRGRRGVSVEGEHTDGTAEARFDDPFVGERAIQLDGDLPDRTVRREQFEHPDIAAPDRNPHGVGRAFDFGIRVGAALEQEPGDVVVAVVDRRIERVTVWRDPLFGQVGIGAVLQEQPDNVDVPAGRGVLQRRTAAGVVPVVVIGPVRQRGFSRSSVADAREIALEGGHPDIDVCSPRNQVRVHILWRGGTSSGTSRQPR